jgi:fructose transport system ATP-binding protein
VTPVSAADPSLADPGLVYPGLAMQAIGLTKRYGHVVAMEGANFELARGEILAVVGENGAGKSTLIKALAGALTPDSGELWLDGEPVRFSSPLDARRVGIETVYQDLAVATQLDITQNMFLGREMRKPGVRGSLLRQLDKKRMRQQAAEQMHNLGIQVQSIRQSIETLSGGQRQAVAVARAAAWGRKVVILDEPTASLGVRETHQVLELIRRVREHGASVVLISHSLPEVFAIADRIHIHRLGRRAAVVSPQTTVMSDVVAVMTGALRPAAVVSAALALVGAPGVSLA